MRGEERELRWNDDGKDKRKPKNQTDKSILSERKIPKKDYEVKKGKNKSRSKSDKGGSTSHTNAPMSRWNTEALCGSLGRLPHETPKISRRPRWINRLDVQYQQHNKSLSYLYTQSPPKRGRGEGGRERETG